jgi:hypothetical protein
MKTASEEAVISCSDRNILQASEEPADTSLSVDDVSEKAATDYTAFFHFLRHV